MLRAIFGQSTGVRVVFDQTDYYGGETMTGRVLLSVVDPGGVHIDGLYLRLRGREKTAFDAPRSRTVRDAQGNMRSETYHVRVSDDAVFLRRDFVLYASRATFMPGEYAFPFTVGLDANLPATFRLPGNTPGAGRAEAALWYAAEAEVAVPGAFTPNMRARQEFVVKDALRAPLSALTAHEERDVTFLCCFGRGSVGVSASLLKNAYGPGEAVQARVVVDSSAAQVDLERVSVHLSCELSLRAGSDRLSAGGTVAKTSAGGVPRGQRAERIIDVHLPLSVPPTTHGRLIECAYAFTVELAVPWSPNVRMAIPVQIHAPPRVVQVVLPAAFVPTSTMPVVDLAAAPPAPDTKAPPAGADDPPPYSPFAESASPWVH